MAWDDIKEQSIEQLKAYRDKIEESSLYIQLKERYDQYPPKTQKIINYAALVFVIYLVLSIPVSSINNSSDSLEKFEARKASILKFLRLQSDKQDLPAAPNYIPAPSLVSRVKSLLETEGLSESQIESVDSFVGDSTQSPSYIPQEAKVDGVKAKLLNLNLKQVVDIGYRLQRLNPGSILSHLNVIRSAENDHFYQVEFELRSYNIPQEELGEADSGTAPKRGRRK